MNIWTPLIGDESLIWRKEKGSECDPHAVAITRNNVVGHVSQNICDHFWKFLSLCKTSMLCIWYREILTIIKNK